MSDWMVWLIGAGLLVIAEILTGTFYLLMIAAGLSAGAGTAAMGGSFAAQTLAAGAVGLVATAIVRRSRLGRTERLDPSRDSSVNLDIGQVVNVEEWNANTARVLYRGALWDIKLAPNSTPSPGRFRIVEVSSNCLIVESQEVNQ